MKTKADVVIIGGGVSGCALAYYLTKSGVKDVVLLEKNYLTSGASGQCAGGLRTLTTSDIKIKLAKKSRILFQRLQEDTGFTQDVELNDQGYLILAYSEKSVEAIRETLPFQIARGVAIERIDNKALKKLFPKLSTDGLLDAVLHKEGATINPHLATFAYAQAAGKMGAHFYTGTRVTGLKMSRGRIDSVVTPKGEISASIVVNAAGLAFNAINEMAGIESFPMDLECIDAWVTSPVEKIRSPALTISYMDPFFLVSQRKSGNLYFLGDARNYRGIPDSYRDADTLNTICSTFEFICRVLPDFKNMKIIRHWMGAIPVSPDTHPILGKTEAVENLYLAGLLSGHGFTLAPMIGNVLADTIIGRQPEISIEGLDLGRFDRGELLEAHGLL